MRSVKTLALSVSLLICLFHVSASAEELNSTTAMVDNNAAKNEESMGTLDQMQKQRAIFLSQAATYAAQGAMNKARSEANVQSEGNVISSKQDTAKNQSAQDISSTPLPSISKIVGGSGGMKVKLIFSNGDETLNKVGDVVSGNLKITSISLNGVKALQLETGKTISLN
jgi:type IV pilus biogenesis protein PilP